MEQDRVECTVRAHGTSQLEIKTSYPFGSDRRSRYRLAVTIGLPDQLGITNNVAGQQNLLQKIRSHTRFQVADISMRHLGDPTTPGNPIGRIRQEILHPRQPGNLERRRIDYEIRTFCNLFVAQTKTGRRLVRSEASEEKSDVVSTAKTLLKETRKTLALFREQRRIFTDPAIPDSLRLTFDRADEYLGGHVVRYMLAVHASLKDTDESFSSHLEKAVAKELDYQKETGFSPTRCIDDTRSLESLVNHESRLKKWVQSTLYLNTEETATPRRIGQVVASVAAASAMTIAVIAAFFADRLFMSYSLPWVLLIVGSYILKDRIKETLRAVLVRYLPIVVSDRTRLLIDPAANKPAGKIRLAVRHGDSASDAPGRETSFVVTNSVRLNGRSLSDAHRRVDGIVDITRIRIDHWLVNMDAPRKIVRVVRNGEFAALSAPRTYRVNVSVTAGPRRDREGLTGTWTVVLNRNGIVRVEAGATPG